MEILPNKLSTSKFIAVTLVIALVVSVFLWHKRTNYEKNTQNEAAKEAVVTCNQFATSVSRIAIHLNSSASLAFVYSQIRSEHSMFGVYRNYFNSQAARARPGVSESISYLAELTQTIQIISLDNFVVRFVPGVQPDWDIDLTDFYGNVYIPMKCDELDPS
jgi:hypothetical protein